MRFPSRRRPAWVLSGLLSLTAVLALLVWVVSPALTAKTGPLSLTSASSAPAGKPLVSGVDARKCMNDAKRGPANGASVQIWNCNGGVGEKWRSVKGALVNTGSGKCLEFWRGAPVNNSGLKMWTCNGGFNQRWTARNGALVNPRTGKCVNDPRRETANGTLLVLWTCKGDINQKWSFKPGPKPTPKPAPAPAGCGTGLSDIWADWAMPNSPGTGLPNPASYTDLGNGTVRDNVTCLVWQRTKAPGSYTFTGAKAYCAGLGLAGGGWHLPTRIQLISIIDTATSGPAIDTAAFPGTPPGFFWTSSPWAEVSTPLRAWIVNFYEGLTSNAGWQSGTYYARCVKSASGSAAPHYQISNGQVTDPATGLTWQRATSAQVMTATQAKAYCAGLTLGGHAWRLPSVKEIATTVYEGRVAPAVDLSAFPDTSHNAWYISSTPSAPEPGKQWALNYEDGFTSYYSITTGHARCVR